MSGTLIVAVALASVWGMAALAWAAALKVSRREGARYLSVLLDRNSWIGEQIWGVRAGLLMRIWLVVGLVLMFVAAFWRP